MTEGVIIGGANNLFDVEIGGGTRVINACPIKGKILRSDGVFYNPLAPGDRVLVDTDDRAQNARIVSLIPRKSAFCRWNAKGKAPQILAANVTKILCVTAAGEPPFRPRFIDRALIQAAISRIEAVVILNKSDLPQNPETDARLKDWRGAGYKTLRVSAKTGEGLSELRAILNGESAAFIGQSGTGKSSLINALYPEAALRIGELCRKYNRGAHTTTRGVLIRVNSDALNCSIIDTPGVRSFLLYGTDEKELIKYFPEMEPLARQCSFGASCAHTSEAGCKILEAVKAGAVSEARYESYLKNRDELRERTPEDFK